MKVIFSITFMILMSFTLMKAQTNMINNGGFEQHHQLPPPNGTSLFDGYIKDWISRTEAIPGCCYLHSPDFYWHDGIGNNRYFGSTAEILPFKGFGQVGVYDYELFQQKLSIFPLINQMYSISFNYFNSSYSNDGQPLQTNSNSIINVYLAKKEVKYIDEADPDGRANCTDEYRNWKNPIGQKLHKIISVPLSSAPRDEWLFIEGGFVVPENGFEYIVVEVVYDDDNYPNGFVCSRSYVLFDEFKMKPFCSHPCAPDFGNVLSHNTDNNTFEDVFFAGDDMIFNDLITNTTFSLINLRDVNYVKIITSNRWGATEEKSFFDPNGLTNDKWYINPINQSTNTAQFVAGRSDLFSVLWNGRINGIAYPQTEVFVVRVIAQNCTDFIDKTYNVTVQGNMNIIEPFYLGDNEISCCLSGNIIL